MFELYQKFDRMEEPIRMFVFLLLVSPYFMSMLFGGLIQMAGILWVSFVGISRVVYMMELDRVSHNPSVGKTR